MRRQAERAAIALPDVDRFPALVARAVDARRDVAAFTNAFRVVDDAADGLPGVVVDRYAEWAVLSIFTDEARERAGALARTLVQAGFRGVYVKHRVRRDIRREKESALAPEDPIEGDAAPGELVVHEGDLHLVVSVSHGLSTGLFTDQRDNRALVRDRARDARVLNLFAYTCSFTVAAALGGAAGTTSVDSSQRALGGGRRNLELNALSGPAHRLLRADAVAFAARARRRGELFDLVILDPPSFGTRGSRTFSVARDYEKLSEGCFALLAPGGALLAVTNHQETSPFALAALLRRAAARGGRSVAELRELAAPADHPHRVDGAPRARSALVVLER